MHEKCKICVKYKMDVKWRENSIVDDDNSNYEKLKCKIEN